VTAEQQFGIRSEMPGGGLTKGQQYQLCSCAKTGRLFGVPIPKDNAERADKVHCGFAVLPKNFCD
jgi:hypothetical protein